MYNCTCTVKVKADFIKYVINPLRRHDTQPVKI